MAEGNELAVAYVSLAVSGQGLRGDVDKMLGQATKGQGEKQGRSLGGGLAKGFGFAAKAGFAGAGALAGTALVKGFGRLKSLDDAKGKLSGLGHSAKAVDGIMKDALASVKGTAFGMDEAASTAAGSVAAGIKPGKALEKNLKLVADAATIAGTDMGSMGSIFNKVAASNKIQGDVIAQLGDQGIPILQFLSKEMGVTAEEASKMASEGKVDFKTFQKAMENGLGGAAQKSGETFSGAFKNMGAAAGRLGANLLSGIFPQMKGGFSGITDLLDRMGPTAEAWGQKVGLALGWVADKVGAFVADFKAGEGAAGTLRSVMEGLFGFFRDTAIPALRDLVGWVVDNREKLLALGSAVLAGVVAFKAFMFIKTVIVAVKAARAAMLAFNLTMLANPIGILVVAIAALVGALVYLYRNNDKAREIMQAAWAGIKAAISSVVDWLKNTAWPIAKQVFSAIGNVVKWLWDSVVKPYIGFIWAYWKTVFGWIKDTGWPWIRSAFQAIGAVAKWLWNNAIKPAFSAIWSIAKTVFGWIKDTGWPWVKSALGAIGNAAKSLWDNWIKPYFGFVKSLAQSVFGWIKDTGWPMIRSAFQAIGDKAKWLWENGVKGPFNLIKSGIGAVKDAIVTARDGIKSAWSKLKGYLKDPIIDALKWMNTNFIGKLNTMLGKIPGVSLTIPSIPGFAAGGWTGPGSRLQPAGVVHADEFVVKKSSRRRFERDNPGALDHINRFGTMPGYAIGGKVQGLDKRFLEQLSAFNDAAGGRYSVYSGYRSVAHQRQLYNNYLSGNGPVAAKPGSSMHNRGLAADLAPSNARNVHGPLAALYGLSWTVPSESWHIEPNWARGGGSSSSSGGGGGFGLPEWVSDAAGWVSGKFKSLTDGFNPSKYGLAGVILPAVFSKIRSAVTKKVQEAASLFSFGDGSGSSSGGSSTGGNLDAKAAVRAVAKRYGWDSGAQWSALDKLVQGESSWNPQAANPSSSARGLFQKMTSLHGPVEKTAAGQAEWGLRYIKNTYGSPSNAYAKWSSRNPHWYDRGGLVKPAVFDNGGTLAPGLNLVNNKLGRPEPLIRPEHAFAGMEITGTLDTPWGPAQVRGIVQDELTSQARQARIQGAR